ncbi:UPF0394 inner membrane protein YeeE-like [Anneissia japonica]|uniref:UPF0394 inner membrane protein YeeE-like n=1 Tax=Anneissia japonica TaxID=1529436 RepID=UPI001425AD67|nr:UPF0394 inner membrane protein YeeE-like [Anneissia japonica]XP_033110449.1 UPF0394 inner membrane protein YeeE-like [Anneissia japonica]
MANMTTRARSTDKSSDQHMYSRVTSEDPNSNGVPSVLESDVLDEALIINKQTTWWRKSAQLLVCALAGIVFGFAMEKGRVFEPWLIRQQMQFKKFVMMKMFLSAVASSLICFSVMSIIPVFKMSFQTASRNYLSGVFSKSITDTGLGGALLGVGMTLSGGCPGNVLIQVGSGVNNAGTTFIGCLVGALIFGLFESSIMSYMTPANFKTYTLEKYFNMKYIKIALPLAAMLMTIVALVEYCFPWTSELTSPQTPGVTILHLRAWPSYLCGALVGLLQIPIILAVEDTLGGSSSYCTMVSQAFSHDGLSRWSPYLAKFSSGMDNWWQVFYVTSAILGGFISAYLSDTLGSAESVSAVDAFVGGILMVFGARLAGGCTSGHGLSGLGTLNFLSFVAVPAMFAGGMATAAIMDVFGYMQ